MSLYPRRVFKDERKSYEQEYYKINQQLHDVQQSPVKDMLINFIKKTSAGMYIFLVFELNLKFVSSKIIFDKLTKIMFMNYYFNSFLQAIQRYSTRWVSPQFCEVNPLF